MSSLYIYSRSGVETFHIIHTIVFIDGSGEIQSLCALMDCSARSILLALRLQKCVARALKSVKFKFQASMADISVTQVK
jgi:hypothetical protein